MHVPPDESLADVLKEVRRIEWQSRRLVKAVLAGGYASVFRGAGLEFHAVREYADGDDERAVDWNVTARMGRPFVKTFVDERDLTVLFVLDRSASMDAGLGRMSPRQAAARVAACLGLAAAGAGDRVGLVAAGSGARAFVPPGASLIEAQKVGTVLAWGSFATIVINFAILAFIIFWMVKAMNRLKREAPPPAPAAPPEDVVLLREIRDLLRQRA